MTFGNDRSGVNSNLRNDEATQNQETANRSRGNPVAMVGAKTSLLTFRCRRHRHFRLVVELIKEEVFFSCAVSLRFVNWQVIAQRQGYGSGGVKEVVEKLLVLLRKAVDKGWRSNGEQGGICTWKPWDGRCQKPKDLVGRTDEGHDFKVPSITSGLGGHKGISLTNGPPLNQFALSKSIVPFITAPHHLPLSAHCQGQGSVCLFICLANPKSVLSTPFKSLCCNLEQCCCKSATASSSSWDCRKAC